MTLAPEGGPVLVPATISGAFLRRAGQLDQATRQALVLAATSDTGDLATLEPGRGPARTSTWPRWPPRRTPGWSRCTRARWSSAIRWPGRPSTPTRRPGSGGTHTGRWPPRCPTGTWTAAPGIWPRRRRARTKRRRPHWTRRRGASRDRSAYATAAAAFERAGRLAADSERRGRLLWQAAEAGWLAGLDRPGGRAAGRGPRAHRRPAARWSRSTGWPATSRRCAARSCAATRS